MMLPVALEPQKRPGSSGNAQVSAVMQSPTFDGFTSWTVFNQQSQAVAYHNGWEAGGKGHTHLLAIQQILHSALAGATYDDTANAVKGC